MYKNTVCKGRHRVETRNQSKEAEAKSRNTSEPKAQMQEIKEITGKCSASDYFSGTFLHNSDQLSLLNRFLQPPCFPVSIPPQPQPSVQFISLHLTRAADSFHSALSFICGPSLSSFHPSALSVAVGLCVLTVPPAAAWKKEKRKRKNLLEIRAHRGAACPSITSPSSSSNSLSAAQSLPCQNSISSPLPIQPSLLYFPATLLLDPRLADLSFLPVKNFVNHFVKAKWTAFPPFSLTITQCMLYLPPPPKFLNFLCKLFVQLGANLGYL